MKFNYYYGSQAEQFSFVRIPRIMLTDKSFQSLSMTAKVLYGVLLDRMSLSMKNGWLDEDNRVYIIYQIGEIMEDLGFTKKKAMDLLQELEGFGLLEKKRRGHGLPNILFVKSFMTEIEARGSQTGISDTEQVNTSHAENAEKTEKSLGHMENRSPEDRILRGKAVFGDVREDCDAIKENSRGEDLSTSDQSDLCSRSADFGTSDQSDPCSRSADFGTQEVQKIEPLEVQKSAPLKNQTDNNYTYMSQKSNRIISAAAGRMMRYDAMRSEEDPAMKAKAYEELIRENIDYDSLMITHETDRKLIDGIVDLILETVLSSQEFILVASSQYPAEIVRSKFLKLNYSHIEYVLRCLRRNTTKVNNIKKYMLAALFNAPSTIDGYYQAEVHHDMPQLTMSL